MNRKLFALVATIVLVLLGVAPAMADSWDQAMIVSVKGAPIEIPGRVLEPGKYYFRFTGFEHDVVDVSTATGHQIGLYSVVPISSDVRKENAQLVLANPPHSVPELKAFFYPDRETGYKFLYPAAHVKPVGQQPANDLSQGR